MKERLNLWIASLVCLIRGCDFESQHCGTISVFSSKDTIMTRLTCRRCGYVYPETFCTTQVEFKQINTAERGEG